VSEPFPELLVQRMDVAKEVDIETAAPDGTKHKVTIWIVVVEGVPYVRSVRGKRGRWYRELTANKEGVLHIGTRMVGVRPVAVSETALIDEISAGFWKKYTKNSSLFSMLRLATLDTTLRLDPA